MTNMIGWSGGFAEGGGSGSIDLDRTSGRVASLGLRGEFGLMD